MDIPIIIQTVHSTQYSSNIYNQIWAVKVPQMYLVNCKIWFACTGHREINRPSEDTLVHSSLINSWLSGINKYDKKKLCGEYVSVSYEKFKYRIQWILITTENSHLKPTYFHFLNCSWAIVSYVASKWWMSQNAQNFLMGRLQVHQLTAKNLTQLPRETF